MWGLGDRLNKLKEAAAAAADLNALQTHDSDDDQPRPAAEATTVTNKGTAITAAAGPGKSEVVSAAAGSVFAPPMSSRSAKDGQARNESSRVTRGGATVEDDGWGWGDDSDRDQGKASNQGTRPAKSQALEVVPVPEPEPTSKPALALASSSGGFFGGFSASAFAPSFNLDAMQPGNGGIATAARADATQASATVATAGAQSSSSSSGGSFGFGGGGESRDEAAAAEARAVALQQELADAQEALSAEVAQRRAFQEMVRQSAATQVRGRSGAREAVACLWSRVVVRKGVA
jgi:hypothetical protein